MACIALTFLVPLLNLVRNENPFRVACKSEVKAAMTISAQRQGPISPEAYCLFHSLLSQCSHLMLYRRERGRGRAEGGEGIKNMILREKKTSFSFSPSLSLFFLSVVHFYYSVCSALFYCVLLSSPFPPSSLSHISSLTSVFRVVHLWHVDFVTNHDWVPQGSVHVR